jgi:hypothetical protein
VVATFGVAGREMTRQRCAAERDLVAVAQNAVGLGGAIAHHLFGVRREVIRAAAGQQGGVGLAHQDARAGQLLHQRVAAGVIGVRVAVQDDFDVREFEAEFRHAVADARHGRFKPGIHEDVPLRRGDEKRTDAGRADVMDVADEAKRRERRVPRLPFLFDRRVFGGVLFGQGRFAQRDLGREAGEQQNQKFRFMFIITSSQRRRRDIFVEPKPTIKFSSVRSGISR